MTHLADYNAGYPVVCCSAKDAPTFVLGWRGEELLVTCKSCLRVMAARKRE